MSNFETNQMSFTKQSSNKKEKIQKSLSNRKTKSLEQIKSIKLNTSLFFVENINKEWEFYGNTMTSYQEEGVLCFLIIGGNDLNRQQPSKHIYKYNTTKQEWCQLELQLKPRYFHTTVYYKSKFYVFGGRSNGYYNEFYEIDSVKNEINLIQNKNPPCKRYGHSSIVWNHQMVLFGGYDDTGSQNDELYFYDFEQNTWTEKKLIVKPLARFGHSCDLLGDNMYIFGGLGAKRTLGDLWKFDLVNQNWVEIKLKHHSIPRPVYGHFTFIFKNFIYIFGGKGDIKDMNDIFIISTKDSSIECCQFNEIFYSDNPDQDFDPFKGQFNGNIYSDKIKLYILGGLNQY